MDDYNSFSMPTEKLRDIIDRSKRESLILLMKATGSFWLLRFFPIGVLSVGSSVVGSSCSSSKSGKTFEISRELFPQSVASGDVTQNSAVIWTRTNSDPSPILYQIAKDENFENVIYQDVLTPSAQSDYTLRVKVKNLSPAERYYYRFLKDDISSPIGTFKTLPSSPDRIRFAFVSCQDYTNGFYSSWYHLAQEDIDFVVHLGDYIYETAGEATFQYAQLRKIKLPPYNVALTLDDYRTLYKIYRSDFYLQLAHERFPFYIIWDDHEYANDAASCLSPDNGKQVYGQDCQIKRRLEASQVWFEYMPADVYFDPKEEDYKKQIKIYRSFSFGNLATLILTDERLYRSPHPCGEGTVGQRYLASVCEGIYQTSMLGDEQLDWFKKQLEDAEKGGVIWKIHGNEVCISRMILGKTNDGRLSFLNLDQWDGYSGERQKIFDFIVEKNIKNYFVITGDLHTYVAGELYRNFDDINSERVGVEFTGTSITSSNLGSLLRVDEKTLENIENTIIKMNQNLKFFNSHYHGYAICELTPEESIVEFWRVSSIEDPIVQRTQKILLKKFRVKKDKNIIEDITPAST